MSAIDPGVTGRKTSTAIVDDDTIAGRLNGAISDWLKSFGPLAPFAVPIADAQQILGRKCRSQIYEACGRGELVAVKDRNKTLITVESIKAYVARLRPAQIKPPRPRHKGMATSPAEIEARESPRTGGLLMPWRP